MCVTSLMETEIVEKDLTAYKITNWDGFSRFKPES